MAGQRGRDLLLRIGDGGSPESFATVAGVRTREFAFSADALEATSLDSPDQWRELLAGAGTKRASVAGFGVFQDAASDARLRLAYFSGDAPRFQLVLPDVGVLTGPFAISELAYGGEHDGEATFSIRLDSAGALSFAAI